MLILGIESSCDETSASIVENGTRVHSCVIASSGKDFEKRGGVIPEDAARKQVESILPVIEKALKDAKIQGSDIDAIAVTYGPGLLGSLLVGTTTARALSEVWRKPIIPVHHTLGHLSSVWIFDANGTKSLECDAPVFPSITLSVSGGHTDLWYRTSHMKGVLIGRTIDDAAGEAFDKGAVLLGLPYPGGPALSALAETGDITSYRFPSPLKNDPLHFSFSGLKTSLKYVLRDLEASGKMSDALRPSIAASFEHAIIDHLVSRIQNAYEKYPDAQEIHCVGGVSANRVLRKRCEAFARENAVKVRFPSSLRYCTDNAAMIASAGYFCSLEEPKSVGTSFMTKATIDLASVVR